jgi:hypothetical protein
MGCFNSKQVQEFTVAAVTAIANANAENNNPQQQQPSVKPWDQPQAPATPAHKPVTRPSAASAASTQPSSAELTDISLCAQKLWDLDSNRLENHDDYKLNVQVGLLAWRR